MKTFTDSHFLGIESLYKPTGWPSFEVLSYILDSELENVRKVMKDEDIDASRMYACGDLKEIYSRKNNRDVEVKRVSAEVSTQSAQE